MADKTLTRVQGGSTDTIHINTDKFAGVRTMTATAALGDNTTQVKVTVTGTDSNGNDNSALSGTYTRSSPTNTSWNQVDGNGNIYLLNGSWNFIDGSDGTPSFTVAGSDRVPWQVASSFASNNVTFSSVEETITVDRTASVVDSDRAGESRPLLSKVVGGAAAAYSLRDLNEKGGHNLVVDVRNDSNVTEKFKAIDLVNGNLLAHCGSGNGFVEKWYDQSGNGNHATQTTIEKQPKIVDSGSLVTGGIDFLDGTDTHLDTTNTDICDVSQLSIFTVLTPHLAGSQRSAFSCGSTVSGSNGYGGWKVNMQGYLDKVHFETQTKGNTSVSILSEDITSSECLLAYVATFPNATGSINGGTAFTKSDMATPSNPHTTRKRFRIGCQYTFRVDSAYTKPIKEIIIYTTDQSANRPAIEANIKNQYNLT